MSTPTPAAPDKPPTLVLGVGNLLMEDEGIGVHLVRALEAEYRFTPDIDLVDGGTAGLELIDKIDGREQVLILDAVEFNMEPGEVVHLRNGQIRTQLEDKMSLHHLGLTDVLSAAELLEIKPPKIHLIGIQPQSLETRITLSPLLKRNLSEYIEIVLDQLGDWGIEAYRVQSGEAAA